ncbi:MAG TPA: hypothetical protein VGM23_09550, partial [Armatimonadota bacterium]
LQRGWWQGGADARTAPTLPEWTPRFSQDLTEDWAFAPASDDAAALTAPNVDTAKWARKPLGIWSMPDLLTVKHGVFRRNFTVPAAWNKGRVEFWLTSYFSTTFVDEGRVYIDGKMIRDFNSGGLPHLTLDGALQPGTTHEVVVEIRGKGSLTGCRGRAWIAYLPDPQAQQNLAGDWQASKDALRYDTRLPLPGDWRDFQSARRTVVIDKAQAERNVILHTDARTLGVIINGKWLRRFHHVIGEHLDLNITPWVKFGAENEIEIVGGGRYKVNNVSLHFYDKQVYP